MNAGELAGRILSIQSFLFWVFLIVLAFGLRNANSKNFRYSSINYFFVNASLSLILALTLRWWTRNGSQDVFWLFNVTSWKYAFSIDANWAFNFLLFIPASIALLHARRNPVSNILFLSSFSFAIETIQGMFRWGASDPADWLANSLGAFVGTIFYLLISVYKLKKVPLAQTD